MLHARRRSRWLPVSMLHLGMIAMLLQQCYVPQLLAASLEKRARQQWFEQQAREQRLHIDESASPAQQQAALHFHAVNTARSAVVSGSDREATARLKGDLEELARRFDQSRVDFQTRTASLLAQAAQQRAADTVFRRIDAYAAEGERRFRDCVRLLRAAAQADDNALPARAREVVANLEHAPGGSGKTPYRSHRRAMSMRNEVPGQLPFGDEPWTIAGPDDVLTDLLHGMTGVSGMPGNDDTLPATPEIDFDIANNLDPVGAKAAELGHDPVKIFEFVRNSCVYEPYFGAVKSASRTLREGRGNDADLASLLIALLRASGVPARYVFGTIQVPVDDAAAWLGVTDATQLDTLFRRSGIPMLPVVSGGHVSAFKMDHIWVKCWVQLHPFRGEHAAVSSQPSADNAWLEVDPSFKQHTFVGRDVRADLAFNPDSLGATLRAAASPHIRLIPPSAQPPLGGSVFGAPEQPILSALGILAGQLRSYIAQAQTTADTVFRDRVVADERFGLLPITDQFAIIAHGLSFNHFPANLRQTVHLELQNVDGRTALTFDRDLPSLSGHRLTLGYVPAPTFEAMLPLLRNLPEVDASLMQVQPILRMDAAVAASAVPNTPVSLGAQQRLIASFTVPGQTSDESDDVLLAGALHALVLDPQRIVAADLEDHRALAAAMQDPTLLTANPPEEAVARSLGEVLHGIGLSAFYQADRFAQSVAGDLGVLEVRHPSLARVSWDFKVTPFPGTPTLPMTVASDRVSFSIVRDAHMVVGIAAPPPVGSPRPEEQFVFTTALLSDALESTSLLQSLAGHDAASVATLIRSANTASTPVYTVTGGNVANVLQPPAQYGGWPTSPVELPQLPGPMLGRIAAAAATQTEAVIPQVPATAGGVPYCALMLRNPTDRAADLLLVDAVSDRVVGAELPVANTTLAGTNRAPLPSDLLELNPDPLTYPRYLTGGAPAAVWLQHAADIATATALRYLPAIMHVDSWCQSRSGFDPLVPVISALTTVLPIDLYTHTPVISSPLARSGQPHPLEGWVRPPASGGEPFRADVLSVSATVTLQANWHVHIHRTDPPLPDVSSLVDHSGDPSNTVAAGFWFPSPGQTAPPGTMTVGTAGAVDGTYSYTIDADIAQPPGSADQVAGSFSVDMTLPAAAVTQAQTLLPGRPLYRILGTASDTHLTGYDILAQPVGGGAIVPLYHGQSSITAGILGIVDATPVVTSPGAHFYVWVHATDAAGNQTSSPPFEVTPVSDTEPPTITLASIYQDNNYDQITPGSSVTVPATTLFVHAFARDTSNHDPVVPPQLARIEVLADGNVVASHLISPPVAEIHSDWWPPGNPVNPPDNPIVIRVPLAGLTGGIQHAFAVRAVDVSTNLGPAQALANVTVAMPVADFHVTPPTATHSQPSVVASATLASPAQPPIHWHIQVFHRDDTYPGNEYPVHGSPDLSGYGITFNQPFDPHQRGFDDGAYWARLYLDDGSNPGLAAQAPLFVQFGSAVATILNVPVPVPDDPLHVLPVLTPLTQVTSGYFGVSGEAIAYGTPLQYEFKFYADEDGAPGAVAYYSKHADANGIWRLFADEVNAGDPQQQPDGGALGRNIDPVLGAPLANFDMTAVPSGVYWLTLTVTPILTSGPGTPVISEPHRFALGSSAAVGQFAFTQRDLVLQTPPVSLAVARSYSTFDAQRNGPFGYGWTFSVNDLAIDLHEDRTAASSLPGFEGFGTPPAKVRVGSAFNRDVTLTLPDGQRVTFAFDLVRDEEDNRNNNGVGLTFVWRGVYSAPDGVKATLRTTIPQKLITMPPPLQWNWEGGNEFGGEGSSLEYHDFSGWILTLEDGTTYSIARQQDGTGESTYGDPPVNLTSVFGDPYVEGISSPTGDAIGFDYGGQGSQPAYNARLSAVNFVPAGVSSTPTRQRIAFYTNPITNHIEAVYGPDAVLVNGSLTIPDFTKRPSFVYGYNGDDLTRVYRILSHFDMTGHPSDAPPGVTDTSQFVEITRIEYNSTGPEHIVSSIKDPRGLQPTMMEYDNVTRRLIATIDQRGRRTVLQHDTANRVETIYDRNDPPGITLHVYDQKGNVTRTIDPTGRTTDRTYNDVGLELSQAVDGRLVARYEYDGQNNRTLFEDGTGRVTRFHYTYFSSDPSRIQVLRVETANGNASSTTEYDDAGRVLNMTTGNTATINHYDDSGRLLSTGVSDNGQGERPLTTNDYEPGGDGRLYHTTRHTGVNVNGSEIVDEKYFVYDLSNNEIAVLTKATNAVGVPYYAINWTVFDEANRPVQTFRESQPVSTYPIPQGPPSWYPNNPPSSLTPLTRTVYNPAGQVAAEVDYLRMTVSTRRYDVLGGQIETAEWEAPNSQFVTDVLDWAVAASYRQPLPQEPQRPSGSPIVTRTVYDDNGRPIFTSDRAKFVNYATPAPSASTRGAVTRYDESGRSLESSRVWRATAALSETADGLTTTVNPPLGSPNGPVVYSTTSTDYDGTGRTASSTDALGHLTRYEYDDAGRRSGVVHVISAQHQVRTGYEYDSAGRLHITRDPVQHGVQYGYDDLGRRTRTEYLGAGSSPLVTLQTEYDGRGRRFHEFDAMGRMREFFYDDADRLVRVMLPATPVNGGQPAQPQYRYSYDGRGNLLSIISPANDGSSTPTTTFTYDEFGRQVGRQLPAGQSESFTYDDAGRPLTHLDFNGRLTRYFYDHGRLTDRDHYADSAGTNLRRHYHYTYEPALLRLSQVDMQEPVNGPLATVLTTVYGYDEDGRRNLVQTTHQSGASSFTETINYQFDSVSGHLQSTEALSTNYAPTLHVDYGYDELDRLSTVTEQGANGLGYTYGYDDAGNRNSLHFPGGSAAYTYDPLNRLRNLAYTVGAVTQSYAYDVQNDGRRTRAVETGPGGNRTVTYDYDELNRLKHETAIGALPLDFTYTYDLCGNRKSKIGGGHTVSYQYDANDRLLSETGGADPVGYQYDPSGFMTAKTVGTSESFAYTPDAEGRLGTYQHNTQTPTSYRYDHDGMLVRRTQGTISDYLLNDAQSPSGSSQVMRETTLNGSSSTVLGYVTGSEVLGQHTVGGASYTLLGDGHANTRFALASITGTLISAEHYGYDAFGNSADGSDLTHAVTCHLYCGERLDAAPTGMTAALSSFYYLRARFYDTASGRFNSMDPFAGVNADPQSLHKYTYCAQDPTNFQDPSGMFTVGELLEVISNIANFFIKYQKPIKYGLLVMDALMAGWVAYKLIYGLPLDWTDYVLIATIVTSAVLYVAAKLIAAAAVIAVLEVPFMVLFTGIRGMREIIEVSMETERAAGTILRFAEGGSGLMETGEIARGSFEVFSEGGRLVKQINIYSKGLGRVQTWFHEFIHYRQFQGWLTLVPEGMSEAEIALQWSRYRAATSASREVVADTLSELLSLFTKK